MKRIFDIIFSLIVLTTLSPLLLVIALGVWLTSSGPILYRSRRVTLGGRLFNCLKFRTMYTNADERLQEIIQTDPERRAEWNRYLKLRNDPRITPLGSILRKTSLDEMPQFLNALFGDISVVGPRPFAIMGNEAESERELTRYLGHRTEKILSIKPGITGLWQTSGRNQLSLADRVRLDEVYVDTRSFFGDLVLIAKTVPTVLLARGAY